MSGLSAFLSQNAIKIENEKYVISDRFLDENKKPIEWEIKAITEDEIAILRKSCTKKTRKNGVVSSDFNYEQYRSKLITECVVFPNLKDAELQKSYGVMGAESLAKIMLKSGEYADLLEKVQLVNGFEVEMEEIVDEVKN